MADKDELLRRVTGGQKKLPQVPPPIGGLRGGSGNPPLPQGKVVAVPSAAGLTPSERETLEKIGWDDSMPIPANMAEIVQQVQAEKAAEAQEVILPVHPGRAPLKVPDPVPFQTLPTTDKERLRRALATAAAQEQAAQEALEAEQRMESLGPGVADAFKMVNSTKEDQEVDVDIAAPVQPSDAPRATAQTEPPPNNAGTEIHPVSCPHCNWDLRIPDVPEPPYSKKMAFLHTVLGQQCFTDDTELFGGSVIVTFRTLTIREIEVAYKQAYRDREVGRAQTELDFWERVNRYRLFMQLKNIRTLQPEHGFVHDLPDGLSPDTNAEARKHWEVKPAEPGETILCEIEDFITSKVLKTEALFRVVNAACNQFNRMVSKLEAMVDNSDFWKPTEEQS